MKRKKFLTWVKGKSPTTISDVYPPYEYATLDRRHIQRVLDGKICSLLPAFYWGGTPFGRDYWSSIHVGAKPLDDRGRDYLRFLLSECDRRNV